MVEEGVVGVVEAIVVVAAVVVEIVGESEGDAAVVCEVSEVAVREVDMNRKKGRHC